MRCTQWIRTFRKIETSLQNSCCRLTSVWLARILETVPDDNGWTPKLTSNSTCGRIIFKATFSPSYVPENKSALAPRPIRVPTTSLERSVELLFMYSCTLGCFSIASKLTLDTIVYSVTKLALKTRNLKPTPAPLHLHTYTCIDPETSAAPHTGGNYVCTVDPGRATLIPTRYQYF